MTSAGLIPATCGFLLRGGVEAAGPLFSPRVLQMAYTRDELHGYVHGRGGDVKLGL